MCVCEYRLCNVQFFQAARKGGAQQCPAATSTARRTAQAHPNVHLTHRGSSPHPAPRRSCLRKHAPIHDTAHMHIHTQHTPWQGCAAPRRSILAPRRRSGGGCRSRRAHSRPAPGRSQSARRRCSLAGLPKTRCLEWGVCVCVGGGLCRRGGGSTAPCDMVTPTVASGASVQRGRAAWQQELPARACSPMSSMETPPGALARRAILKLSTALNEYVTKAPPGTVLPAAAAATSSRARGAIPPPLAASNGVSA